MRRWLRLVGALLALGLVLGACGGDDSDSDEASGSTEDTGDTGTTDTTEAGNDTSAPADCTVCIEGLAFNPDLVNTAVGSTVTWANLDSPTHTVTADDGSFDSGELATDATFEFTFDEPGEFTYHCEIHSTMTGTIFVE